MGDKNAPDISDIIKSIKSTQKDALKTKNEDEIEVDSDSETETPRGRPKSGRIWKSQKERFNVVRKSKKKLIPVEKHLKFRNEIKHIKELSKSIVADRKKQNEEYRQRREENLKRRQENERKNEIVQVIKNTAKIKRMSKKQLRKVEKRDTTKVKSVN